MNREFQLILLILLAVIILGALLLLAIRKKADAWADQYERAQADEARGVAGDYPAIGSRAQRISWRQGLVMIVIIALAAAVMGFFQWLLEWAPHNL